MSATQLSFTLRTSPNVKTAHLVGSWDNYTGQLPLSSDGKPGAWKGHFRFQASTLAPGQRYWYYYIMDGYHVSHDPAKPSTVEPTTGRKLNVLDVPPRGSTASAGYKGAKISLEIPTGRGLSPSRIVHPKPSKPYASRAVREADYSISPVDDLASHMEKASLYSPVSISMSPTSSVGSSLSSSSRGGSSRGSSSPSSLSSLSDHSRGSRCSCKRYGITRKGQKVLLDCGGSVCGYSDDSSSACSSSSGSGSEIDSDSDSDVEVPARPIRKQPGATVTTKPRVLTVEPRRVAAAKTSRRR